MKSPRYRLVVGGVAALSLVLAGCGGARSGGGSDGGSDGGGGDGKTFTIKFSHVVTDMTPKGKAALKFKEIVEKKSNGKVKVEIYPNSELYGDKDEMQALQSGSVQMIAPSSAKFTTVAPQLQVLDLPFLFDSPDDIPEVASPDTKVGQAIFKNKQLEQHGMKVLGLWDSGMKQLSAHKPLNKPSDLKGLSFRIQPSDVLKSQFKTWGANPSPLAFAEVYNALQQKLLDGQENTYSNIQSQNMHTVQEHLTESDHGYIGYVLVINQKFYKKLPADLQKVVTSSATEASDYNREVAQKVNAESKKIIEKAGTTKIHVLTPAERKVFKDTVVPKVWNQYADVLGKDLIAELLQNEKK